MNFFDLIFGIVALYVFYKIVKLYLNKKEKK